jgi:phosphoribosylformimino-5-aminoimidazole carboxamide ribotide isomerase
MDEEISIEQIRHELTWKLRQKVLYPEKDVHDMSMEEDMDGIHFGAFKDGWLVGVISLFQKDGDFQFRKVAVDPVVQNMGVGSKLLDYVTAFALNEGGKRLWCNARLTAIPFYLKHGFTQTGKTFEKGCVDYETMEKYIA